MDDMDGLEVLKEIRRMPHGPEVVMISGHADINMAVTATRLGAYDFLEKPFSSDRVLLSVKNALERQELSREVARWRKEDEEKYRIIGESKAIKELLEFVKKIAPTNSSVLITGESGTGKELFARLIHRESRRADGPFVMVNSAAIPRELVESELFGYERGAFTGAYTSGPGKFELADSGTIFLDEIGDMPLTTQSKLLRVLQDGECVRIGGRWPKKLDIRVIVATNKDLVEEIKAGRFREDLYYRLNVIPLHIPPLRERIEDIPLLIDYYMRKVCKESGKRPKEISREALAVLIGYPWRGNVRELKNIVERLVAVVEGERIALSDIPFEITSGVPQENKGYKDLRSARFDFEREYIKRILLANAWNITEAAKVLGLERSSLHRKMNRLGLCKEGDF
jgi:two-component system nitrogen regulation response regulator NtrX